MSNEYSRRLINELINKYRAESARRDVPAGSSVELEIRFRGVTREMFESVYESLSSNPEFVNPRLECSVNVLNPPSGGIGTGTSGVSPNPFTQYIRKMIISNGTIVNVSHYMKESLERPLRVEDYVNYVVALARETPTSEFKVQQNALLRFKARLSFDYISKWRFDITAVKVGNLSAFGSNLRPLRDRLFPAAMTAKSFLRELDYDLIDAFEVELEYIGRPDDLTIEDFAIVKKLFTLVNPQYLAEISYQDEIYYVAQHILPNIADRFKLPSHRLKQLSNQAITLNKNTYYQELFPPSGYFITDKADGQRAIISVNGNRCRVLKSDGMDEYFSGRPSRGHAPEFQPGEITIVDVELIGRGGTAVPKYTAHIFDVMVLKNKNVTNEGFVTRVGLLDEAAAHINAAFGAELRVAAKQFIRCDPAKLEDNFREIYDVDRPYEIDGIILTEPDKPYPETRNYKWKPPEKTTIDFYAVKCPQNILGVAPYIPRKGRDLYLLFVGINHNVRQKLGIGLIHQYKQIFSGDVPPGYYPVQFSPSAAPYSYVYHHDPAHGEIDRQIVELGRDPNSPEGGSDWIFHRTRVDRRLEKYYFGNDYRIAELTFMNFIDPFEFSDLWSPSFGYFAKSADGIYSAPNRYKRFVISLLLKSHLNAADWVIDEASGRGADLHRYQEIGVKNALFIDVDPAAIAELIRRKFSSVEAKRRMIGGGQDAADPFNVDYAKVIAKDSKNLTVHTLVADLKMPYERLMASILRYGAIEGCITGIVCNFAFHYLCDSKQNIRNLLTFNYKMLKPDGIFIFTVMDGAAVYDLLKDYKTGQQWESREGPTLKYAIKKLYTDKLMPAGQMIEVLLPFSDKMYTEPLCNVGEVIKIAEDIGFKVELDASMSTYFDKFAQAEPTLFKRLTEEDKHYISLHKYVTLRKVVPARAKRTGGGKPRSARIVGARAGTKK